MTQVRDIVTRSMRLLGVLQSGENPSAEESEDGMAALNDMLNAWADQGVDLEFFEFTSINDTVPYPEDHMAALRYNLAIELAPEFGVEVSEAIAVRAKQYFDALQVKYSNPDTLSADAGLLLTGRYL